MCFSPVLISVEIGTEWLFEGLMLPNTLAKALGIIRQRVYSLREIRLMRSFVSHNKNVKYPRARERTRLKVLTVTCCDYFVGHLHKEEV